MSPALFGSLGSIGYFILFVLEFSESWVTPPIPHGSEYVGEHSCMTPQHTLVYFGHFSPQKKIKLVLLFHLNKNYQAEQCDTVLKSHRPHFWQIAMSCNHHSHNVQLTHPQMHGFFLALECSISIKCGGQKSFFYTVHGKKKSIMETFLIKLQKKKNWCPAGVSQRTCLVQLGRRAGRFFSTSYCVLGKFMVMSFSVLQ